MRPRSPYKNTHRPSQTSHRNHIQKILSRLGEFGKITPLTEVAREVLPGHESRHVIWDAIQVLIEGSDDKKMPSDRLPVNAPNHEKAAADAEAILTYLRQLKDGLSTPSKGQWGRQKPGLPDSSNEEGFSR